MTEEGIKEIQKQESTRKLPPFFVFSKFRIIFCVGCCLITAFFCAFGGTLWKFYFGEGNAYSYTRGALAVHFVDVGMGDCIIIQLPDGKVVVIDGGEEIYASRVANYLRTRVVGWRGRIDYLINTHAHSDHYGTFPSLLKQFDVGVVYRPHNLSISTHEPVDENSQPLALAPEVQSAFYADFITAAYQSKAEVQFIEAGISITDGKSYDLFFHTPTLNMISLLSGLVLDDFNEISPIITLSYGNTVFVLTGDAGAPIDASVSTEQWFVQMETAKAIDFTSATVYLKVGHHGSYSGTREHFLNFIKPNKAIISYGESVSNFPHESMIDRLTKYVGTESIYKTAIHGNIAVQIRGNKISTYLGFENAPNLALLWVVLFASILIFSFLDYSSLFGASRHSKERSNQRPNADSLDCRVADTPCNDENPADSDCKEVISPAKVGFHPTERSASAPEQGEERTRENIIRPEGTPTRSQQTTRGSGGRRATGTEKKHEEDKNAKLQHSSGSSKKMGGKTRRD